MAAQVNLRMAEGKSFRCRVRWYSTKHVYIPIQSLSNSGPLRIVTQTPHGIPNGWKVAVVSAKGLTQVNALGNPPGKKEYNEATVVDSTTLEFNGVNSTDFGVHTVGTGYIQFFEPMPLTNTEPRWVVKDRIDGVLLLEATVANGKLLVNSADFYYDIFLTETDTANLGWKKALHELESRDPSIPFTYQVISGRITATQELAT